MKITIKTLQQKLFTVDVEPEDTVATIKTKINADHGHPVDSQKLIYSGMYFSFMAVFTLAPLARLCHPTDAH